ncbi:MAG: DedA family protein [bacterium]
MFVAIFLEDFGIPVPGETLLIAGALLASHGDMHIVVLILTGWAAAVMGDNIGYAIGLFGGRHVVLRYGNYIFLNKRRLESAEGFFCKYGGIVVVGARFFELLRQLNGIVAGIAKMPWWKFLIYNAIGAALWVGFWCTLFYLLGENANRFAGIFKRFEFFLIGGIIIVAAIVAIHMLTHHK